MQPFVRKNRLTELPLSPFTIILLDGHRWTNFGPVADDGWELHDSDSGKTRILLKTELMIRSASGDLQLEDDFGRLAVAAELSDYRLDKAILRLFWITAIERAFEDGEISEAVGLHAFQKVIDTQKSYVVESMRAYYRGEDFDFGLPQRKRNGGSVGRKGLPTADDLNPDRYIYDPKTLERLHKQWESAHGDMWNLVPKSTGHAHGGPKVDPRTINLIHECILRYPSELDPSIGTVTEYINGEIAARNAKVGPDIQIPDSKAHSVQKAINDIPAYMLLGSRLGEKKARALLRHTGKGRPVPGAFTEVLFDCWEVHAHTLINEEAQSAFKPEELTTRIVLSVGLEVNTGCIVALEGGPAKQAAWPPGHCVLLSLTRATLQRLPVV